MSVKQVDLSVIIPCFNEEAHIAACLESLVRGTFPHERWEILIVDGGSTDGTLEIVERYRRQYPFIRVLANPDRTKPVALNLGIRAARGEVIMRIDAHARYDSEYVTRSVTGLIHFEADNIGGRRETHIDTRASAVGVALALAVSDPIAVGNAHYRTNLVKGPRPVDTVFCGCFRADVFRRVGLFNERLVRTQDRELNIRLRKAGGRVLMDPAIRCEYFPRQRLGDYLRWNWNGAYWLGYARRFTRTRMLSWRNVVPVAFALYVVALLALCFLTIPWTGRRLVAPQWCVLSVVPLCVYAALTIAQGYRHARRLDRGMVTVTFPTLLFLTHVSYGLALPWGWLRGLLRRREIWTESNERTV